MTNWISNTENKCPVKAGTTIDVRYHDGTEETLVTSPDYNALWWASTGKDWRIVSWRIHTESPPWRNVVDLTAKAEYSCPQCKDKDLKIEELTNLVQQLQRDKDE